MENKQLTVIEQIQKQDGVAYSDYMYLISELADFIVAAKRNCKTSDLVGLSDEVNSDAYVYKSEAIQDEYNEIYDQLDDLVQKELLDIEN
jgi:hypothetical protein